MGILNICITTKYLVAYKGKNAPMLSRVHQYEKMSDKHRKGGYE